MMKLRVSRMKKVLTVLLAVLFVVSVIAVVASAAHRHPGPVHRHPGGGHCFDTAVDIGTVAGAMTGAGATTIGIIIGGMAITTQIVTGC
jgi:hypothetical protein